MPGIRDQLRNDMRLAVAAGLAAFVFVLALVVFVLESETNPGLTSVADTLYWAFVTMTTVGYGDRVPLTPGGKLLTVGITIGGIGLTSLVTATIASRLVTRRLREGRGMEEVRMNGHVVVCGWNDRAAETIANIAATDRTGASIVLVTSLPEEELTEVLAADYGRTLRYVRGDPSHESILRRAHVQEAAVVILLAESWHGYEQHAGIARTPEQADNRTLLTALAARSINPDIRMCGEAYHYDSVPHLKRAGLETVLTLGEHNDFLLASAAVSPGVTRAAQDLLTPARGHALAEVPIPVPLQTATFADVARHFRATSGGIAIGLVSRRSAGMTLDSILAGDMSAVDKFIKKQFEGVEDAYFSEETRLNVTIAPPDDYVVQQDDRALLIVAQE